MSGPVPIRQRARILILSLLARAGFREEYFLTVLAVLIGVATGTGAHLFFRAIEIASEFSYDPHGGWFGGRSYMLVVLPVAGAILVGIITYFFASEAKGHGVPEVMDAIYRKGGIVRPRVALAKAVTSALTIGSGGSAGTEGPIIQIGAAIGSGFGQFFQVHRRYMSTLVACGAAGGIASIFNAPIAGVLFSLEIFLRDFSLKTFAPVVFASVISCSITHAFQTGGDVAMFAVHRDSRYEFTGAELPFYLVLGLLCALAAVAFIKALYATEDLAERTRIPSFLKPAVGALALGLLGMGYLRWSGTGGGEAPQFFGNGYPLIESVIDSRTIFGSGILVLGGLGVLKIVATCATLGWGGSGGIFAPSLFIGATVGGSFGLLLHSLGFIPAMNVSAYALVGMAAVVAGTTHAPLTSIVILYEITREPRVILPVMFAAIVAVTCAQRLCGDSIYTLKLRRRGVRLGTLADLTILKRITADQVAVTRSLCVHPEDPVQKLIDLATEIDVGEFIVVNERDEYVGLVVAEDLRTALLQPEAVPLLVVGELMRTSIPVIHRSDALDVVFDAFSGSDVDSLPIASDGPGERHDKVITLQSVMNCYQAELDRPRG